MSVMNQDAGTLLVASDWRLEPRSWSRVAWVLLPTDLRYSGSRMDGAQGMLAPAWWAQPEVNYGWGSSSLRFAYTLTPTIGGDIYSRPVFMLTVPNAGTNYNISQIRLVNTTVTPNQEIDITFAFQPGDVLTIDCSAYTVKVNGIPVDFAGQFPVLDPRAGATNNFVLYALATDQPTVTPEIDWTSRWLS